MSRATVRKANIDRAIAVVRKAGLAVAAVEIRPDGTIRVITDLTAAKSAAPNAWDQTCAAE